MRRRACVCHSRSDPSRKENRRLERDGLHKLELQPGSRVNHGCTGSVSVVRLSRCLWRACRFDAAGLYRDPASICLNRGKFHSKWSGFARIGTRRRDLSKRFGSSFQYNVSLYRNVLPQLRLEASAHDSLRADKTDRTYSQRRSSGNRSSIQGCSGEASTEYGDKCSRFVLYHICFKKLMVNCRRREIIGLS